MKDFSKKLHKYLSYKQALSFNRFSGYNLAIFAVIFVIVSEYIIYSSFATGFSASFEAEKSSGTSPATTVSDAQASGGQALKFQARGSSSCPLPAYPDVSCTGTPAGVTLHSCSTTISTQGNYDSCSFAGGLDITNACKNTITITRSLINGQVSIRGPDGYEYTPGNLGPNASCDATGVTISDTTINCGCLSQGASDTPVAVGGLDFTLLRDNIYNSGHGVAPDEFVTIQDSYIHNLGGNTDAHKDGLFVGDGDHMTFRHNNIECNDGPKAGCTSAIGLLTDFSDVTFVTIDNNLLNTIGSYCLYASGGPQKSFSSNHLTVTNNHFGRKITPNCGSLGPVTYFNSNTAGNVWSGNVWDDTGQIVPPVY